MGRGQKLAHFKCVRIAHIALNPERINDLACVSEVAIKASLPAGRGI